MNHNGNIIIKIKITCARNICMLCRIILQKSEVKAKTISKIIKINVKEIGEKTVEK